MQRLELNVKFNKKTLPNKVTSSIIKPSNPERPFAKTGVEYSRDKQWATWVIDNPKRGYCYRIHWE
jgi:hypothetical protein